MGKAASPPPAPDPVAVAKAQEGTNIGTSIAQSHMNNVNRIGPGGSTIFNESGGYTDPQSGQWVPSYTETTTLSPLGNQLLQGQQGLANSYLPMIEGEGGNIQPLDISGGANGAIVAGGPQAYDQNVANAVYKGQTGFLDPQWQQREMDLNDQLSRQGVPVGSPAWNDAQTQFNNDRTQAYNAAGNNAIATGSNIAGQNFGLALQGQNQNVNLQQLKQANPLALLAALTSGAGIGGSA